MSEFNLTFTEMTTLVFDNEGYGVGENFQKGVFLALNESDLILKKRKTSGIGYSVIGNPVLSKGLLNQKYKIIVWANDKELGLV